MQQGEFNNPRLVKVYDAECPWSRDDDFFLALVNETPAARVLDLGCGTGRLTIGIAAAGHTVTGVDPAKASIDEARSKPGAGNVTWIEGTSSALPDTTFDVAVMTSHVAQFFIDDDDFGKTLTDVKRALVPGGRLMFDSRDPRDRSWERWNRVDSRHQVTLEGNIEVDIWTEVTDVRDDVVVDFAHHYCWPTGEKLLSTASLRFRPESELRKSLEHAGFTVEQVYGGWHRQPVGAGDGEFLVIART